MREESATGAGPVPVYAHILRLGFDEDLRSSLERYVANHQLTAGFVITAVGSLRQAVLRFADQSGGTTLSGKYEIVSLAGTLSAGGVHLHIARSDAHGQTIGGHHLRGCEVYTTVELVIGVVVELRFDRETDPQTGFRDLVIHDVEAASNEYP